MRCTLGARCLPSSFDLEGSHEEVPVNHYAKFFDTKWWRSDFSKYGTAELKFSAINDNGHPLKSVLRAGSESQDAEIIRAFRSRHTVRWMLTTASPLLRRAGHTVLERFLKLATFEAASSTIFRRRLHYDRASWDKNFAPLFALHHNAKSWYDNVERMIQSYLSPNYSFQAVASVAAEFQTLIQSVVSTVAILKELVRAVAQECNYAANLDQLAWRQDVSLHRAIYVRYMAYTQG